jgi:type I restriction-modification system DNA methylase subunit
MNKSNQRKGLLNMVRFFTSKREVNAILNLVKQETERIDLRFLEPACGTGNFLTEILERKLKVIENRYKKNHNKRRYYEKKNNNFNFIIFIITNFMCTS